MTNTSTHTLAQQLKAVREASYRMATLSDAKKTAVLNRFADILESESTFLLAENQKDLDAAAAANITGPLAQRLKLDTSKIQQLAQGLRDVAKFDDPVGKTLLKTLLDDGLTLEKVTVPLGVVGIIFESRPDVLPQILSLILKTGNAVVFKGGRETKFSNGAMMTLVKDKLNAEFPELPDAWACLLESREEALEMLDYPEYLDLVIPRGSNQLVQSVMARSKAPVLGHADGICHQYVHASSNLDKALEVIIDSKIQYPAACNALETVLIDDAIAPAFLPQLQLAAIDNDIILIGCEQTRAILPDAQPATEDDWRSEYGDLRLSVKIVSGLDEAIQHINTYGSHHTDGILAEDSQAQALFLAGVDAANVYVNASTRFADGFRYGFGAEVGISTSKTHARGPVGIDGLLSTKYRLLGSHHVVKDYVGQSAKPFKHTPLS
jgi:glutamate-5-semialdehyde dehydrogenase